MGTSQPLHHADHPLDDVRLVFLQPHPQRQADQSVGEVVGVTNSTVGWPYHALG